MSVHLTDCILIWETLKASDLCSQDNLGCWVFSRCLLGGDDKALLGGLHHNTPACLDPQWPDAELADDTVILAPAQ